MTSKMNTLYRELSEHAAELGFESIYECEAAGYKPNYTTGRYEKEA